MTDAPACPVGASRDEPMICLTLVDHVRGQVPVLVGEALGLHTELERAIYHVKVCRRAADHKED